MSWYGNAMRSGFGAGESVGGPDPDPKPDRATRCVGGSYFDARFGLEQSHQWQLHLMHQHLHLADAAQGARGGSPSFF
jgi:hypothetical protein